MKKRNKQLGEAITVVLGLVFICLSLSVMGVKNYYLQTEVKSQVIKYIPSKTDIYTSINFHPFLYQLKNDNSDESKKLKDLIADIETKNGINFKEDILTSFEPEISLAVFKTENACTFIKEKRKYNNCKKEISKIADNLQIYYEKNKRYPSEVEELVPDYIEKLPLCPEHGKYIYRSEGKEHRIFTIECSENTHKKAGIEGAYPAYKGEEGEGEFLAAKDVIPQEAYPEWLILGDVKDKDKAESLIAKIKDKKELTISESEYKNQKIYTISDKKISYSIVDKVILAGSNIDIIKNSIDVSTGSLENIEKNNLYIKFMERKPEHCLAFTFMNLEDIMVPVYSDITEEPWDKIGPQALKAMKSFEVTLEGTPGGIKANSFLSLDKENGSNLIKILTKKNNVEMGGLKLIPDDISILSSNSDIKNNWEVIKELIQYLPEVNEKFEGFNQLFSTFTGMDIEQDIIDNLTGEITCSMTFTPEYLESMEKIGKIEKIKKDLYEITDSVIKYQKDHNGDLVTTLEELVPEYMEKIPSPPGDSKYVIAGEVKKVDFPAFYIFCEGKILNEIEKDYPRYYSDSGYTLGKDTEGNEVTIPVSMPDTVILTGIKDKEPFTKLISLVNMFVPVKFEEKTYRSIKYTSFNKEKDKDLSDVNVSYSFIGKYIAVTTGKTKAPMEKTIDTFLKNRASIIESRDYKIGSKQFSQENMSSFSFINLNSIKDIPSIIPDKELKKEVKDKIPDLTEHFSYLWMSSKPEDDGYRWTLYIPLKF